MMSTIGKPGKATQDRVIALFADQLGDPPGLERKEPQACWTLGLRSRHLWFRSKHTDE